MILVLGLNLLVGYCGLAALGHAGFSCVGAYVSALLALNYAISPWLGLIAGAIVASLLGVIIAIPSLRLRGDYLAIATFGFSVIVYSIAKNWTSLTRGPMGIPGIPGFSVFGWAIDEVWSYLLLVTLFVFITYICMIRIVNSPFGRVLRGIREDEIASLAIGKNVNSYKILTFAIGAFFAGIAGSLYAHYITFIDPSSFTVTESITILLMVVFGGMASLGGSFVGAAVLVMLPEALRFVGLPGSVAAPIRQMIYGALLVLLMLKRPQGILGTYRWK